MGKGIVLYTSKTGSTQRYAQKIADELGFDAQPAIKTYRTKLQQYDTIIYGGGLYHDKINGISYITDNLRYFPNQNFVVFFVGISPINARLIHAVKLRSFGQDPKRMVHLVGFRGSFDPSHIKKGFIPNQLYRDVHALRDKAENDGHLTNGEKMILHAYREKTQLDYEDLNVNQVVSAVQLLVQRK